MNLRLCLGLYLCLNISISEVSGRTRDESFAVKLRRCFSGGRCDIGQQGDPQDTMNSKSNRRRFIYYPQREPHWGSWYPIGPCIPSCGYGVRTEAHSCFYGYAPGYNCVGAPTRVIPCFGPPCRGSHTTRRRVKVTTKSKTKTTTTSATKTTRTSATKTTITSASKTSPTSASKTTSTSRKAPVFVWKTVPPSSGK